MSPNRPKARSSSSPVAPAAAEARPALADAAYLRDMEALQIPRDLHPNPQGHDRLAKLLLDALPRSTLEAKQ